jgi:hypothetical protein
MNHSIKNLEARSGMEAAIEAAGQRRGSVGSNTGFEKTGDRIGQAANASRISREFFQIKLAETKYNELSCDVKSSAILRI